MCFHSIPTTKVLRRMNQISVCTQCLLLLCCCTREGKTCVRVYHFCYTSFFILFSLALSHTQTCSFHATISILYTHHYHCTTITTRRAAQKLFPISIFCCGQKSFMFTLTHNYNTSHNRKKVAGTGATNTVELTCLHERSQLNRELQKQQDLY